MALRRGEDLLDQEQRPSQPDDGAAFAVEEAGHETLEDGRIEDGEAQEVVLPGREMDSPVARPSHAQERGDGEGAHGHIRQVQHLGQHRVGLLHRAQEDGVRLLAHRRFHRRIAGGGEEDDD